MVTLHHFTHPQWFEELGAFEDVLNLKFFVHFCTKMFEQFGNEVKLWCTINEPGAYIFQGYINKAFPPGVCNFQLAGEVLRNMLLAHVLVYRLLKKMPGGDEVQIGLVHQYMTFEPYNKWNLIEKIPTVYLNYIFNDVILNFLRTGEFSFCIPFKYMPFAANVSLDENGQELDLKGLDLEKRPYFDFIGLNFYSRAVVQQAKWNIFGADAIIPSCMDGEIMTDMQYPMYADGLYDAIKVMSEFNVPIYITENGIADAKDDRRELFFKDYLAAVSRAINDGFDVRGWFYWSLMDNFEWNDGFIPKFGLYEVDFQTKTRTLRPSVLSLQAMLSQHKGVL
jgi:beta-glucosidase